MKLAFLVNSFCALGSKISEKFFSALCHPESWPVARTGLVRDLLEKGVMKQVLDDRK
jgi:hypothetical protein